MPTIDRFWESQMTRGSEFRRYCEWLIKKVDELLKTSELGHASFELDRALEEMSLPPTGVRGFEAAWEKSQTLRQTAINFQHGHSNRSQLLEQFNRFRLTLVEQEIAELKQTIDDRDPA